MIGVMLMAIAMQSAGDARLGRYAVKSMAGKTICVVTLTYEPSVGGEFEGVEKCAPALEDAARWRDDGAGGFYIDDPLRQRIGHVVADEAGMTLTISDGRAFRFDSLTVTPEKTPTQRAIGWWTAYYKSAPWKHLCKLEFRANGIIGPATGCPVALRIYAGGKWRAADTILRLTPKKGKPLDFRWGDAASLIASRGTIDLVR